MRVDTVLPADSAEFCPSSTATHIFVVGTYQLETQPPLGENKRGQDVNVASRVPPVRRRGQCLVFEVDDADGDQCSQLQEIPMPAVLDMKWASNLLAIADAEGHIIFYCWQDENRRLEHVQTLRSDGNLNDLICLSLDWAKDRSSQSSDKISVSLSNGSILIARHSEARMVVTDTWVGHDFEPWVTAWDRWDQNFIYTGGDDCALKGWDLRVGFTRPVFLNKRFDAGVTAIQSNPHLQNTLAVGSYDSTVRLFDNRKTSHALTQAQVGGGVWRVKWHPDVSRKQHLLTACMHDGFKVVNFEPMASTDLDSSRSWHILTRFDDHDSLAYGADWSYAPPNKEGSLVASCSFYDHSLHLWRA